MKANASANDAAIAMFQIRADFFINTSPPAKTPTQQLQPA